VTVHPPAPFPSRPAMPEPMLFSWSGGKDSAMALHALRAGGVHDVRALLTTVTEGYDRISMHGVRRALLERQAAALGLPLHVVEIPRACSNDDYARRMDTALRSHREAGVETVVFGDIFLEDVRRYREDALAAVGMRAVFPLWGRDTTALAAEFLAAGFRAVTACVDGHTLDRGFVGRELDAEFLAALPEGADPCGENGEYHSFVYDGPGFAARVEWVRGEEVLRDERFWYCDLLPAGRAAPREAAAAGRT
jgi:uncharacterized protein (TIGR00290 family)